MRGGSPAAETDHAWAAAAHISPLCKVADPPMINSTGEPNGGYFACPDSADSTDRDRRAGFECPAPDIARRPTREAGRREIPGACRHRPLCSSHGNFPELGKFPAPLGHVKSP